MVVQEPATMPGWKVAPFTMLEMLGAVAAPAGGSRYMSMPSLSHQTR